MESTQHDEDSKSSSDEEENTDRPDQDTGTGGRSYECVFCKRGFTTAQALGGHMNIHRKDRAKSRPGSVPSLSSKVDEDYASFRGYPPIQSYPPHYPTPHDQVHINYHTFFPASTAWGVGSPCAQKHNGDFYVQSPHHLYPFGDDWRRSLSLQIGPSHVDGNTREKIEDGMEADDELDLELRLGHDP